jgi:hypothetical protein
MIEAREGIPNNIYNEITSEAQIYLTHMNEKPKLCQQSRIIVIEDI